MRFFYVCARVYFLVYLYIFLTIGTHTFRFHRMYRRDVNSYDGAMGPLIIFGCFVLFIYFLLIWCVSTKTRIASFVTRQDDKGSEAANVATCWSDCCDSDVLGPKCERVDAAVH